MPSEKHLALTPDRLLSLDACRGIVTVALASDGFGLARAARKFPESDAWRAVSYQFEHVAWVGCALWDLIQSSFMFMVGVSIGVFSTVWLICLWLYRRPVFFRI